ncbi:putative protein-lysine deacylase ABHD14B [Patella vulgata]|uniref:putative protein-lysine deacylase ABHD14B n=1 Tax=Patella vulgata TaxID=6465 RepID=UPI00217F6855|nr:putative protein-lysine deacylase ABHD14B [Patella vulgata]XP_050411072.1 putative protein-lysine deacylase ABHD14B [Patella vulgata]
MSPSGLQINKPVAVAIFGVIVTVSVVYYYSDTFGLTKTKNLAEPSTKTSRKNMEEKNIVVNVNGEDLKIFTRQVKPDKEPIFDILLLHGQAFSSQNWMDIGTLDMLKKTGYRAVAVDLPGYGKSSKTEIKEKGEFIKDLIKTLEMNAPVIISPSMSGSFALPYIFNGEASSVLKRARAYIPVAPVGTSEFKEKYPQSQIPTLIVRGENDLSLGTLSENNLKTIPRSEVHVIQDAGHACYINKPDEFHNLISIFLKSVQS